MKSYQDTLESFPSDVSLGYETILVYRGADVPALQAGYSVSPAGEPLTGKAMGDWREEWVVVAYEECCGDPIFIDSSAEGFPVYTAIHGEGAWRPEQIAVSLEAFGRALSTIAALARGREHPAALENNPLPQSEKENALAAIERDNPGLKSEFWEAFLR